VEGGDSGGISGTGKTPQEATATEEAYRPPRGKRPPETEINWSGYQRHSFKIPGTQGSWHSKVLYCLSKKFLTGSSGTFLL